MPLGTKTYTLADEAERLDEKLDRLADDAAEREGEDTPESEETVAEAQRVEQQLVGVLWACDEFGDDATITVGDLSTGDLARVQDYTQDVRQQRSGGATNRSVAGAHRIFFCAAGIVDAPFIDEDASFEDKAVAVRNLKPQCTTWLEDRVDDLSTPDVELGNGFAARVAARTSTE